MKHYFCSMKLLAFWKPVLWLLIILVLSLIPGNHLPGIHFIPHFDKLVHAGMYFVLVVLIINPLRILQVRRFYLLAMLMSFIIGSMVELAQTYIAVNRSGCICDELANLAGAFMGIVFYNYFIKGHSWERWI